MGLTIVDSVDGLHEVLVDCQVDGSYRRVAGGTPHQLRHDLLSVVLVHQSGAGQLGVEAYS